jgi:thiosulfate reductase cytochrome b subunit
MSTAIVFSRFERFWHWTQAALIIGLLVTGFTVHGSIAWLDWGRAAELHTLLAWALIILWVFAIFWHAVTGEWRQYIPTTNRLRDVAYYYLVGIFQPGVHHPYRKQRVAKQIGRAHV